VLTTDGVGLPEPSATDAVAAMRAESCARSLLDRIERLDVLQAFTPWGADQELAALANVIARAARAGEHTSSLAI